MCLLQSHLLKSLIYFFSLGWFLYFNILKFSSNFTPTDPQTSSCPLSSSFMYIKFLTVEMSCNVQPNK